MQKGPVKILVAHDGSSFSGAAIESLAEAGLPATGEAEVLTAADVWLPQGGKSLDASAERVFPAAAAARREALAALAEAERTARRGAAAMRKRLPQWRVTAKAAAESPAWAVLHEAERWQPRLVLLGARGHSAADRVLLGSVSQRVLAECKTSVRIGRKRSGPGPLKIFIAVDGSLGALAAVREAASRRWPRGTRFLVAAALDKRLVSEGQAPFAHRWMDKKDQGREWVERMVVALAVQLGMDTVQTEILEGHAVHAIVDRAARWGADGIFIGARGLNPWRRVLLGGVSMGVAAKAPCSVEIVRA